MKKFIFAFFVLPLLAACNNEPPPPLVNDDPSAEDVVYDDTWRYITLYLDGAVISVSNGSKQTRQADNARAMTADSARRGFDYFEVVFYYGEELVAKSSWEIGKRAFVNGVYTGSGGIDYSATSTASGKGCAVLFAGRKTDKTLLAVGKLVSVDDEPTTVITDKSTLITFELAALKAGAAVEKEKSSFKAEKANIIKAQIGARWFPLYILPGKETDIKAEYYFELDGNWNDFNNSIITTTGGKAETREVRYPAGSGKYWYPKYAIDDKTKVVMTNNQGTTALQNPVTFSIDTSQTVNPVKEENGLCSLIFEIPVYPVSKSAADHWFIRPAYASYHYNIDNGNIEEKLITEVNIGGAVLIGVDVPVDFEIPAERR